MGGLPHEPGDRRPSGAAERPGARPLHLGTASSRRSGAADRSPRRTRTARGGGWGGPGDRMPRLRADEDASPPGARAAARRPRRPRREPGPIAAAPPRKRAGSATRAPVRTGPRTVLSIVRATRPEPREGAGIPVRRLSPPVAPGISGVPAGRGPGPTALDPSHAIRPTPPASAGGRSLVVPPRTRAFEGEPSDYVAEAGSMSPCRSDAPKAPGRPTGPRTDGP